MKQHFDTDHFEHYAGEAAYLLRVARFFARRAHSLRARHQQAAGELARARAYRHKANKALNATRQFLPH